MGKDQKGVPQGTNPSGEEKQLSCCSYLKGKCTKSSCDCSHPPECVKHKTNPGCKFGDKCALRHSENSEAPNKKTKTCEKHTKQQLLLYAVVRSWVVHLRTSNCENKRLDLRTCDDPSSRRAAKYLQGYISN